MSDRLQRIALFVIADEVLKDEVLDLNTRFFIEELNKIGVEILIAAVLPDNVPSITKFIKAVIDEVDYVILTGGIGPTPDDVTREAVSEALGISLITDPDAERILEEYYGGKLHGERLRMARVPEGSLLIPNPISGAPGFVNGKVMVFPGIPSMVKTMFPFVKKYFKDVAVRRAVFYLKAGESSYSDIMREVVQKYSSLSVGSYPTVECGYKARIVIRGKDLDAIKECVNHFENRLSERNIDVQEKFFE